MPVTIAWAVPPRNDVEHVAQLFELARGDIVESTHYGAIAEVDSRGKLLHSPGDPNTVAFLRSSAKPLGALPFLIYGMPKKLGLNLKEQGLLCASHAGF